MYPTDWDNALSKKPICGVLAVAIAGNVTFARATEVIKQNLMPWQKRHGGRTYLGQITGSLVSLGVSFHERENVQRKTLQRTVVEDLDPSKTYLIGTSRHFMVYKNGQLVDQYEISPIQFFGARRCFVNAILEIK